MERRLELISEMSLATWIHLVAVVLALIIGALVLWRRKGNAQHRFWGRIWVGLMFVGAVSSFWIQEINEGSFSAIHLLSIYTLFSLGVGLYAIRNRAKMKNAVNRHKSEMQSLYALGLLIAGGFTFLPYRLLGRLTFGESTPALNLIISGAMIGTGLWLLWRLWQGRRVAS